MLTQSIHGLQFSKPPEAVAFQLSGLPVGEAYTAEEWHFSQCRSMTYARIAGSNAKMCRIGLHLRSEPSTRPTGHADQLIRTSRSSQIRNSLNYNALGALPPAERCDDPATGIACALSRANSGLC